MKPVRGTRLVREITQYSRTDIENAMRRPHWRRGGGMKAVLGAMPKCDLAALLQRLKAKPPEKPSETPKKSNFKKIFATMLGAAHGVLDTPQRPRLRR